MPMLEVRRLGRTRYEDVHRLQQELLAARVEGRVGDLLLLTEHDAVVTLGRKSKRSDVAGVRVPIVEIERGGEATFHGPGQLVGYPILLLDESRRDLHRYLRDLEEVLIRALADFGVEGRRESGFTGVWIGAKKVASIGVAVRRWVTWHGFALDVDVDLAQFRTFAPCGLDASVMTNLAEHARAPLTMRDVEIRVEARFRELFDHESTSSPARST